MEVFVTCSAEYVTKTSIFRPYYEFMPILPRCASTSSSRFLSTYIKTLVKAVNAEMKAVASDKLTHIRAYVSTLFTGQKGKS